MDSAPPGEDGNRFGDLLRSSRIAAGMSQEQLAERAGLSTSAVSALERGARLAPRLQSVIALATALELDASGKAELESSARRARRRHPRPDAAATPPTNLPRQMMAFFGRQAEIATIGRLLETYPIVTVTGTGGIGKTRAALEVAGGSHGRFPDGVWFVDLAALSDPALIVPSLAAVIGLASDGGRDLIAVLATRLKTQRALVILDNCEHLIAHTARVASQLSQAAPGLRVLATSRERLGIAGETVFVLPAFPVPPSGATHAELQTYDSIHLFAERARATVPNFTLTEANAPAIAAIARRVEGIALAIELAAARLATLGLAELHARLDDQLRVLRSGRRDVAPRQKTLEATIAWSYDLLEESERVLLRRLSIFPATWEPDAATALCSGGILSARAIVDIQSSLVEKSLVAMEEHAEVMRYRLLDATRTFASEKLRDAGEEASLARAHAAWMASIADLANREMHVLPRQAWIAAYDPELDNARAAVRFALGSGNEPVLAGRILGGLRGAWLRASGSELQRDAERALERIDAHEHPDVVASLYLALLQVVRGQAFSAVAERAAVAFERVGNRMALGALYYRNGWRRLQCGELDAAREAFRQSLRVLGDAGFRTSLHYEAALQGSAIVAVERGRTGEARSILQEATTLAAQLGDRVLFGAAELIRAAALFVDGDASGSAELAEKILSEGSLQRDDHTELNLQLHLAGVRIALGDYGEGLVAARRAAELAVDRDSHSLFCASHHLAAALALTGHSIEAARILGWITGVAQIEGWRPPFAERNSAALLRDALQRHLSEQQIHGAMTEGRFLSEDALLA